MKLVDANGTMNTIASYAEPGQLAAPLGEIREALRAKGKERRYLQAFRQRHFEFLQRYNGIKHRLKEELDRRKKKTARLARLATARLGLPGSPSAAWTGGCGTPGAASMP